MREFHEVANIFPMMEGDEFDQLCEDVEANGLLVPIWLHPDGSIIDGRNRYRACLMTDTTPEFKTWNGDGSLVSFVVSLNLHRRHLTASQRAVLAVDVLPMLEAENPRGGDRRSDDFQSGNNTTLKPRSREEAGDMFNVSPSYVQHAKKLSQEAPDLLEQVRIGAATLPQAKREMNKRQIIEKRPKPIYNGVLPTIHEGRAEDLHFLEDSSIDLIITSPPYNLGGGSWPMGGNGATPRQGIGYADDLDEMSYQDWQAACLSEWYRVAKDGASLFYNHKVRQSKGSIIHPLDWLRFSPWTIRQEIIWDRGSTHNHAPTLFWPHDERIYWLTKGRPNLADRSIGFSTIWKIPGPIAGTWHPAPFTDELPKRCIEAVAKPGDVILDPFGGSMTTVKVAGDFGYTSYAVEINSEYIAKAKEAHGWTTE